jgi:hypothetical protein
MKVSTENDNNFGYEQITILGDNMPLNIEVLLHVSDVGYIPF